MCCGFESAITVLLATIVSMAFSAFWYSPKILGNAWADLANVHASPVIPMRRLMCITFIATLALCATLFIVLQWAQADTATAGLVVGVFVGCGVTGMSLLIPYLWEGRPLKLYLIIAGCNLCNVILTSTLMAHMIGVFAN